MSKIKDYKSKTLVNLIWKFLERIGNQGVAFVVSIVLARLLSPDDYGLISLVTIFTSIFGVFVNGGLGTALIQKKDADDLDFSTVFYSNIFFGALCYLILFLCAPLISAFYNTPELTSVIRVLGLTLIISGFSGVQSAYVSKKLIFKKFFFSTLGGTLFSAVIGITMAYFGFGVWALVAQQVSSSLFSAVVLWIIVKWYPKKMFSFNRLKSLFSFGWKLLVSQLINTVYNDIRQLIIGKIYSTADLAYYNRGKSLPNMLVTNINTSIDSVLLPVMSDVQDQKERLKSMTRRAIKTSSYIMWPMMFGLMAIGENFVHLVLTDKWLPSLPFLYVFCFVSGLQPIQTANLNVINAMGRSDLYLKMEITKKTLGILIVLITMKISVLAMAIGSVIYTIIVSVINAFPNKKLINYTYFEQIKDMAPAFILALFMAVIVKILPIQGINMILQLIIQIFVGALIYVLGSIFFKLESFIFIKNMILGFIKKKRI